MQFSPHCDLELHRLQNNHDLALIELVTLLDLDFPNISI